MLEAESTQRTQRVLVAIEVAPSVMLVAGAVLFTHSFVRLSSTNPGFRADQGCEIVMRSKAIRPDREKTTSPRSAR